MVYKKPEIIKRKIDQLGMLIYDNVMDLHEWETRGGIYSGEGLYLDVDPEWSKICVGDTWRALDHTTRWFRKKITITEEFARKNVYLELSFGGEGLVRVNGHIVSTITTGCIISPIAGGIRNDYNRTRVLLAKNAVAFDVFEVEIESSLHYLEFRILQRGAKEAIYTINQAALVTVNELVERTYFDFKTAYGALLSLRNPLENLTHSSLRLDDQTTLITEAIMKDSYAYGKVANAIVTALSLVDLDISREQTLASLPAACVLLAKKLDAINLPGHALVKLIGQAHIDTAWLWTIRESIRKTGKTLANALALMDAYPEFIFAFSQPQLFEFCKEHYPDIFERVKEKVANGQLELVGNAWVEMDTNIPSGESLVRQLLYGSEFYKREFGRISNILWLPDVFGYTWSLPQIMKRSGIKYFYTAKLNNNDTNRFPHSLFIWKGTDGSCVTAYLQRIGYNGFCDAEAVATIYNRFDQKDVCNSVLLTFGFGDGGGGPTYDMIETGRRLKEFPGFQRTEFAPAHTFFDVTDNIQNDLPVWNNEIYFEWHRGVYSSQASTKKNNRKNELLYRQAEISASIAHRLQGTEYPYDDLLRGYKRLLTNQFHDILPGSSFELVYKQADEDYAWVQEIGRSVQNNAQNALLNGIRHNQGDIVVLNYLSWEYRGIVYVEYDGDFNSLTNVATNETIQCFRTLKDGILVIEFEAVVPPMGWVVFTPSYTAVNDDKKIAISTFMMENEYLRISFDEDGCLTSIYDKTNKREALSAISGKLIVFEDKPAGNTAWEIDIEYQNKWWIPTTTSVELTENNSLRAVLRIKRIYNNSEIVQDIVLTRGCNRIDFETYVDWHETEKMIKAEFFADVLSSRATYEIQFGAVERPTHWNTSLDMARFEVCGHKWADLSEGDYGVALLNDCKYGYDIKDNRMRLTLLRSTIDPDYTADRGVHSFTYSIYPHQHSWQTGGVVNAAYELNIPLLAMVCSNVINTGTASGSYFTISERNVIIDTVKSAEDSDGLIIRIYEATGTKTKTKVTTGFNINTVIECNLMEENEHLVMCDGCTFSFDIKPFEIKTFRLM